MIQTKKAWNSFGYAIDGVRYCFRQENNFRIHTLIATLVILAGAWTKVSRWEWCMLLLAIGLVMVTELLNTSIERLTDIICPHQDPKAGIVKDVAASAVLMASLIAIGMGACVFGPYIITFIYSL